MTTGQRNAVHRIDRDRRAMHAIAKRRLTNARRSGGFGECLRRPALLAKLQGMRRAVLDASRALRRDVRVAHHELSREDDKKDEREILWLIAFLGLPTAYVATMRDESYAFADRVGGELRRVADVTAAKYEPSSHLNPARTSEPRLQRVGGGTAVKPDSTVGFPSRPTGGNVGGLLRETASDYGRANVSDAILDTWAETVAYAQFERGRRDASTFYPAIAEALWGYRWSSILDTRTTVGCRMLDGWVATIEDAWMKSLAPPRHFNALTAGTLIRTDRGDVSIEDVRVGDLAVTHRGRLRRVYATMSKRKQGNIREAHLSTGGRLRITDEHPVLTTNGWKAARDLKAGDEVFEHAKQGRGILDVNARTPNDFPSLFDEELVAWDIVDLTDARGVILPVELKVDAMIHEREVHREAAERMLERVRDAASVKNADHFRLGGRRFGFPVRALTSHATLLNAGHSAGVVARHSLAGIGPALAERPVTVAGSLGNRSRIAVRDGDLLGLGADANAVDSNPSAKSSRREYEGSFDGSDRFATLPMASTNETVDRGGIREARDCWNHASIVSIADVDRDEEVYNLAVEDDETYVAASIVVHNCRAVLVPVYQSSELRPPVPQNRPSDETLQRYLAQKEAFIRRLA